MQRPKSLWRPRRAPGMWWLVLSVPKESDSPPDREDYRQALALRLERMFRHEIEERGIEPRDLMREIEDGYPSLIHSPWEAWTLASPHNGEMFERMVRDSDLLSPRLSRVTSYLSDQPNPREWQEIKSKHLIDQWERVMFSDLIEAMTPHESD